MNWKYLLITAILATFVAGGTFWLAKEEVAFIDSPEIQKKTKDETQVKEKDSNKDVVITLALDKELLLEKIEQGKEFLLRMEHPEENGFYKQYDAPTDSFEERLHAVYSASIIYTLFKIYDFEKDIRIAESLFDWANFLLSMQSQEIETFGAFHYSYYFGEERREEKFVVGTAALSIFTLLDLYERTTDTTYLSSARMAGDWLQTMQKTDGVMIAYKKYQGGEWAADERESLLYNGQVLAAFSRLYKATGIESYYLSAQKIAQHFENRVEEEGCYLADDHRIKNPISSAWVIMSLLDFYKVDKKENYRDIIFTCGAELLERQRKDGGWAGAYSTSGNGWLAEVMMEMYWFCQEEGEDCGQYKEAVLRVISWLTDNTYSKDNSSDLPNPEMALGGLFWNQDQKYVRTDSVCHGVNAYVGIVGEVW